MGIIQLLPPEEARKIAAGEVIDRPASLIREFIDNSLDSKCTAVEVSIEEGGKKRVEVSDDGSGIARDDLEIACQTHATSKIRTLDDLSSIKTLGFRGEALAAAAAVSRLEILTSVDGKEGWRWTTNPHDETGQIEAARRVKGTTVRALGLFDTIPARKRFLKRDGSEASLCRQIFLDKAMAFPGRTFRFLQDGVLKLHLNSAASCKDRFAQIVLQNRAESAFLHEIHSENRGWSITMVVGGPEIYRQYRRDQYIFANGRRINDYSLQQALEYGTQGAFPNGCHPVGAIFIDIDPSLADFNVHPAKREAKFADPGALHHAITTSLRVFFHNLLVSKVRGTGLGANAVQAEASHEQTLELDGQHAAFAVQAPVSTAFHAAIPASPAWPQFSPAAPYQFTPHEPDYVLRAQPANSPAGQLRFIGTVFSFFLLVEKDGKLYAIDQHAAHERVLYNKILAKPPLKQELLVPIPFTTDDEADDAFLAAHKEKLARLGIEISGENGSWRIDALPVLWRAGDAETVRSILELRSAGENIAERWAATLACHSAIRDGDTLDRDSALNLAEEAFTLPVQRCPHGRPVMVEIKKEILLRAVRRL